MRITNNVETKVVRRLFSEADRIDWAHLTPSQRSAQYSAWVRASDIGGELTKYMSAEAARVWIKDGPMKEWSRAVNGVGKFAHLVVTPTSAADDVLKKALGAGWMLQPGSLSVKPLRVVASRGDDEVVLTWAPAKDFKHLVWAALSAEANGDARDWVLCVTSTFTNPLPSNVARSYERIARRCQLRFTRITI